MMVVKHQSVQLINVSAEEFQKIQATSSLVLMAADQSPLQAEAKKVEAFGWDDRPEPSQSDR